MTHFELFVVWFAIDVLVCMAFTAVLCLPPAFSWHWVALIWLLILSGDISILRTGHCSKLLNGSGTLLFLLLCFLGGGRGKRLWGKIKSAALTAVNQASFRNQQKEAFS